MHGSSRLGLAFALNALFTLVEAVGAWWTHSAAVMSGTMHDVGDCLLLGAAWYFQRLSARGPDERYSYGYARFSMLGGWATAVVLIVGSVAVIALTLSSPAVVQEPRSWGIMLVAAFGLIMNFVAMWALRGGRSLNERGARLHLLEDVLSWASVLVSGAVMFVTHWNWLDAVMSIGIALFVLRNAIKVLRDGTVILMQGRPAGLDHDRIERALLAVPHVIGVHEQHAWSLDGQQAVLTVHVVTGASDQVAVATVDQAVRAALMDLGIHHITVRMEQRDGSCSLQHH